MTLTFTPQRVAELRKRGAQISGTLVLPSMAIRAERTRRLYREYIMHDMDGKPTGRRREVVNDVGYAGDLTPAILTILLVENVDTEQANDGDFYLALTHDIARACGFKTSQELRADWQTRHPRSPLAKLVWFALGDTRDRDRFLQRYIFRGGDYTGERHEAIDPLPALTKEQLDELAVAAQQRHTKRVVDAERTLSDETLAQRVARLEQAGEMVRREIHNELDIIAERARRGLRKIA